MIALAYLLSVAVSLVVLAVTLLRPRPAPTLPPAPVRAPAAVTVEDDARLILATAVQLAARLPHAA